MTNNKFKVHLTLNRNAANPNAMAERIINTLPLTKKDIIADIGAGGGYFSFLFAKRVRKVFAIILTQIV